MAEVAVGVVRETAAGEQRVAVVPEVVGRLRTSGLEVLVEEKAGEAAWFGDDEYASAGASVVDRETVLGGAAIVACVQPVDPEPLRRGQVVVGLLRPLANPDLVAAYAAAGATAVSLDMLPRKLSRAQAMDALTSQANVAGYKAALVAAHSYGRYLPMLMTAAGTVRPAQVLVLGAGVAGLQAIGTAKRLGAVVTAYDVRPEVKGEVESLGATFLEIESVGSASGAGGYARELTAAERDAQQAAMDEQIARFDIVITTAQVPGRRPPVLVTGAALARMRPGSVAVDLASGPSGGNVEGSVPDTSTVVARGVTVIGAGNLPATMPAAASSAYARNVSAFLGYAVRDGAFAVDPADELLAAVVLTHDGVVVHPALSPQEGHQEGKA